MSFAANVAGAWGAAGTDWLSELPEILREITADWSLTPDAPYDLSYHYVAPVTCADGTPAVLKLGVPGAGSLRSEAPALAAFAGRGAARLLRADLDRGALLLERVTPGDRLRRTGDEAATAALIAVMRRLHTAPPPGSVLPTVRNLATAFAAFEHPLAARAAGLWTELCDSAPAEVVLHGDLHHDNILRATREPWLAIDPHGVIGDPGYEIGAMLFNPDPADRSPALTALVPARLEQLADGLAMPPDRAAAWGFVRATLSAAWTASAGGAPSRALDVAQLLAPRVP